MRTSATWVDASGTPRLVWMTDARRQRVGTALVVGAVVVSTLVYLLSRQALLAAGLTAAAALAALTLQQSGRTGFYEATAEGLPAAFLGRGTQDLDGLTRIRRSHLPRHPHDRSTS